MSKICKNCGKEHDGSYGKGEFCSLSCARSYAGKKTIKHNGSLGLRKQYTCEFCGEIILGSRELRSHLAICPNRQHTHKGFGNWKCNICGEIFASRRKLYSHRKQHDDVHKKQNHFCECNCQFCGKSFTTKEGKSVHEKFCSENPNKLICIGHPHTEKSKKKLSEIAKANNFGGWHTSKSFEYNGIKLDSKYEVEVAKSLDENKITWERPDCFIWHLNEEEHRYYPDFYLPEYNVYLDPKNDFLIEQINPRFGIKDSEKIKIVEEENNIRILILNKEQLSWDKIKELI